MALLVEYKYEQTILKHASMQAQVYQASKNISIASKQDINTSERQRERNRKHERFILRFEHTCSTSPPSTLEGFPLKSIPPDHSVPQYLQGVHTRTLGLTSPLTCSRKNKHTQVRKLVEAAPLHRALTRTRNNANPQVRLLKYNERILW